jgi:hypothetical protein
VITPFVSESFCASAQPSVAGLRGALSIPEAGEVWSQESGPPALG